MSTTSLAALSVSLLSLLLPVNAQVALTAEVYQGCYSSISPMTTMANLTWEWQSSGWCQKACGINLEQAAFGLTKGNECYCGNELPANSTKVDDSQCNRPCVGYPSEMCGGQTVFSVYTSGLTASVDSAPDSEASSASTVSSGTIKATSTPTKPVVSMVTQAGATVFVTQSAAAATTSSESKSTPSSGPSKAGIAAGVVVGVVVIATIIGGLFFYFRHRSRREIEKEHQRQEAMNFARTPGTLKSEHSMADSRMDPVRHYRRQSDGSIADDLDISRRVLKITNPDRNTMVA